MSIKTKTIHRVSFFYLYLAFPTNLRRVTLLHRFYRRVFEAWAACGLGYLKIVLQKIITTYAMLFFLFFAFVKNSLILNNSLYKPMNLMLYKGKQQKKKKKCWNVNHQSAIWLSCGCSPSVIHNVYTKKCIAADQTHFFTLLAPPRVMLI